MATENATEPQNLRESLTIRTTFHKFHQHFQKIQIDFLNFHNFEISSTFKNTSTEFPGISSILIYLLILSLECQNSTTFLKIVFLKRSIRNICK